MLGGNQHEVENRSKRAMAKVSRNAGQTLKHIRAKTRRGTRRGGERQPRGEVENACGDE